MFDWFTDVGLELSGIDSSALKKARAEKQAKEKAKRYIFSKKAKVSIIALGILYLVMSGSIFAVSGFYGTSMLLLIKTVLMCGLDIGIIIALLVGKKRGEIVALILSIGFVCMLYFSVITL